MEKQASRTYKVMRNTAAGTLSALVILLLKLADRTVFIYTLSKAYAGISGLYASVFLFLSLAELGIGTAITYALYRPLADGDTERIKSLMRLYKNVYRIIGLSVLGIGLVLIPFLPRLMSGATDLVNIYLVYGLYLGQTVASYLFFAYKGSLLSADQKDYTATLYNTGIRILTSVLSITVLLVFRHTPAVAFCLHLGVTILTNIAKNIVIAVKVDRMYPYLREKNVEKLPREERRAIGKNVIGLSAAKANSVVLTATDNIVIKTVLMNGLSIIGIYSNYLLIIANVNTFLGIVSNSLTPSIGNLLVSGDKQRIRSVFDSLSLMFFWLYGFCGVCYWNLFNPFIAGVWINADWLLSDMSVFLITANIVMVGVMSSVVRFRDAAGLYWDVLPRFILSALLNIGLSFVLAGPVGWGMEGILLATVISRMLVVVFDPPVVFRKTLGEGLGKFYVSYFLRLLLILATGGFIRIICSSLPIDIVWAFLVRLVACLVIPNALWYLIYRKTPAFAALLAKIRSVLANLKSKLTAKVCRKKAKS